MTNQDTELLRKKFSERIRDLISEPSLPFSEKDRKYYQDIQNNVRIPQFPLFLCEFSAALQDFFGAPGNISEEDRVKLRDLFFLAE